MSSILSCRQQLIDLAVFIAFTLATGSAMANPVHLGPNIRQFEGQPYSNGITIGDILASKTQNLHALLNDIQDCQQMLAIPLGQDPARDATTNTSIAIDVTRAECWSLTHFDPTAQVLVNDQTAKITLGMITTIMDFIGQMSFQNDVWVQTFMHITAGAILCDQISHCRLSATHAKLPPEQTVDFDLILSGDLGRDGTDDVFIEVTQLIYGKPQFVYAIWWKSAVDGGIVAEVFPTPQNR